MNKDSKKSSHNIYLKNLDKLMLFITSEEFKKITKDFRKKFNVPKDGFKNNPIPEEWFLKIAPIITDAFAIVINEIEQIIDKKLPSHFEKSVWKYLIEGNTYALPQNFSLRVSPVVKQNKYRKIEQYANEIQLITYAPLTTKEQKLAFKELKKYWGIYFPPTIARKTRLRNKNIDLKYEIEEEMKSRIKPHKKEIYEGHYLSLMEKKLRKGLISEKEFKDVRKKNPHNIKIIKEGKTSKDIARKKLKNSKKADNVRQINSRIKRKRKDLFG